jgi:nicotinate-nucleotide--dimethylbenzimidazole phosphoribosyltransferase
LTILYRQLKHERMTIRKGNGFMKLEDILKGISGVDRNWVDKAQRHTGQLVMPPRALGRLHDISERLCAIQETLAPSLAQKAIVVMAGDHGIAGAGVSAYPQEVTGAMVQTFLAGGAGINAISKQVGADVWVVDMGIIPELDPGAMPNAERLLVKKVATGTRNFAEGPAMTRREAQQAIETGFAVASDLFECGVDVLGTGDMGIGNTTPSAAIGAIVTGASLDDMAGRGTGIDTEGLGRKIALIRRGIEANRPDNRDGLDVLKKVGGFEIGGIAGLVLAGAYHRRPVVVDGFISTAGALIADCLCPQIRDYIFAGHRSEEPGHRIMLQHLSMKPILDLGMRLGEGTGGALAMGVIEAAARMFREVMTFEQAGVPEKE